MSRILLLAISLLGLLIATGCEDVIDIPLKTADAKLVIEAKLNNIPGDCSVKLSKIVSYEANNSIPPVSNANVVIKDNAGNEITLSETAPGLYTHPNFTAIAGRTYYLTIISENKTYTATSQMPQGANIDSAQLILQPLFFDTLYTASIFIDDPAQQLNFYRIIYSLRDTAFATYVLYDDSFFNGEQGAELGTPPFFRNPLPGDSIEIELRSLDRPAYKYYQTLAEIVGGTSGQEAAPANPTDNIEGDGIGYFSAYYTSRIGFKMPQ